MFYCLLILSNYNLCYFRNTIIFYLLSFKCYFHVYVNKSTSPQINGIKLVLFVPPPPPKLQQQLGLEFPSLCRYKERHVIALLRNNNPAVLVAGNWIPSIVRQGDTPIQAIPSLVNPSLGKVRDYLISSLPSLSFWPPCTTALLSGVNITGTEAEAQGFSSLSGLPLPLDFYFSPWTITPMCHCAGWLKGQETAGGGRAGMGIEALLQL